MKFLGLILINIFLVGCASSPNIYNPDKQSFSELATISGEDLPIFNIFFKSSIVSVFDKNGKEVIASNFPIKAHKKVTLEPGNYLVVLRCYDTYLLEFPAVKVNLSSSEKYIAYCRRIREDGSTVDIEGLVLHDSESAPSGP